jgi:DNA repair and recombination protein RAD54B
VQLRDIFRVHLNTGSNTHDLLQCECDQESDAFDEGQLSETKNFETEKGEPCPAGFVAASEVRNENLSPVEEVVCVIISHPLFYLTQLPQFLQKKKDGLAALSEWKHLNCLKPDVQDSIHDDVLRRVCTPARDGPPRSHAKDILSMIDLEAIQAMETTPIQDVPGGTITFLFQKSSLTNLEIE